MNPMKTKILPKVKCPECGGKDIILGFNHYQCLSCKGKGEVTHDRAEAIEYMLERRGGDATRRYIGRAPKQGGSDGKFLSHLMNPNSGELEITPLGLDGWLLKWRCFKDQDSLILGEGKTLREAIEGLGRAWKNHKNGR